MTTKLIREMDTAPRAYSCIRFSTPEQEKGNRKRI